MSVHKVSLQGIFSIGPKAAIMGAEGEMSITPENLAKFITDVVGEVGAELAKQVEESEASQEPEVCQDCQETQAESQEETYTFMGKSISRDQAEALVTSDLVHNVQDGNDFDSLYEWFRFVGIQAVEEMDSEMVQESLDNIILDNLTQEDLDDAELTREFLLAEPQDEPEDYVTQGTQAQEAPETPKSLEEELNRIREVRDNAEAILKKFDSLMASVEEHLNRQQ